MDAKKREKDMLDAFVVLKADVAHSIDRKTHELLHSQRAESFREHVEK